MNEYLPFVISGITAGAVYGLAGTGLVLAYRTSGLFNFAHGAVAAAAAYVFYWLNVDHQMPWVPALVLSVFVLGPVLGLGLEVLAKELSKGSTATKVVGTIGIVLIVQGLATVKYGTDALLLPDYLPKAEETFELGGVNIAVSQVIITVVALLAVAGLYVLFRFTRLGIAMRAVVDDPELVSLHGGRPRRVRSVAWVIGSTFAALSGVLVAPMIGIEAVALTYLVVQAFGAAAVGGFASIPITFLGGLLLGVGSAISTKFVVDARWLDGLPSSLPFIVLFIALLAIPKRKLTAGTGTERREALQWTGPAPARIALGVFFVALLLLVPSFAGTKLGLYTVGISQAILLLSLGLLVRTAGMVSLCHAAFAAIGAVAFAQYAENFDLPWMAAVLLGALTVVPVAALLALPAIRLSGLFLALATLGFGLMIERMFYARDFMFTPLGVGRVMPRPGWASSDKQWYFLTVAFLVVVALGIIAIHRARLGRVLRGLAESPTAITTLGLNTSMTRVIVFCISGFLAGIAGILYGCTVNVVVSSDAKFLSFHSLLILATLALAPFREPWYAVFGIVGAVIPAYWESENATSWINVIFGAFAVLVALRGGQHPPMPKRLGELIVALSAKVPGQRKADEVPVFTSDGVIRQAAPGGLVVEGVTVRFGGHTALDHASVSAPTGRITGLIGPNGAGKTTLFNASSGLLRPTTGHVRFHGKDVTRSGPAARGAGGLGRTFQIMQLCDSMTVYDNVLLGCEAGQAGATALGQVVATPGQLHEARAAATEAMRLCRIEHLAGAQAGGLSTGQRRLVDLARCLAGSFDVLLLDEPSSGLDAEETRLFAETLTRVVRERGTGILIVEHDVALVMEVCAYIYVLDFGKMIFEGTPAEVAASTQVQAAYLGTEIDGITADVTSVELDEVQA